MANLRKNLSIVDKDLWYIVGLIATDGCLSSDGRHIDITAKDRKFLFLIRERLGLKNKIGVKYNGANARAHHIQITNKNFYDFLLFVGLTPKKSLTLSALAVPEEFFGDFLRGVIDGDGCLRCWRHPSNNREQWSARIYSGSERFIQWLRDTAESILKIKGRVYKTATSRLWTLKYGKMATQIIARRCYYKECFGLKRKILLAQACQGARNGWRKSKTVILSA